MVVRLCVYVIMIVVASTRNLSTGSGEEKINVYVHYFNTCA